MAKKGWEREGRKKRREGIRKNMNGCSAVEECIAYRAEKRVRRTKEARKMRERKE